jgi:pimeloyl-ACP methyl ester carboxylesterase
MTARSPIHDHPSSPAVSAPGLEPSRGAAGTPRDATMVVPLPHSRRRLLGSLLVATASFSSGAIAMPATNAVPRTSPDPAAAPAVAYRNVEIDGVRVFYREAGPTDAPTLLLLHGFPSSSHMYRDLIPGLADRYHLVAPDYPGFGYSDFPDPSGFAYTFDAYARLIDRFVQRLGLERHALYIQDYGAPIGLRLALLAPDRVSALIVQNGNAYEEGLSADWDALKDHWCDPTPASRERLRGWLSAEGIRQQYTAGLAAEQAARISPDTWTLDWALLNRPGNIDVQLDLFGDYRSNVALYPQFQRFLSERQPPTLIVWGRHDPFFTRAGAEAYRRDVPDAELHLLDAGHFALETHAAEITRLMREFLARRLGASKAAR